MCFAKVMGQVIFIRPALYISIIISLRFTIHKTFLVNKCLESGRCCFRINHYGPDYSDKYGSESVIAPCCLEMISCEDYDKVFQGVEDGAIVGIGGASIDMLEGTIGDHDKCPKRVADSQCYKYTKLKNDPLYTHVNGQCHWPLVTM